MREFILETDLFVLLIFSDASWMCWFFSNCLSFFLSSKFVLISSSFYFLRSSISSIAFFTSSSLCTYSFLILSVCSLALSGFLQLYPFDHELIGRLNLRNPFILGHGQFLQCLLYLLLLLLLQLLHDLLTVLQHLLHRLLVLYLSLLFILLFIIVLLLVLWLLPELEIIVLILVLLTLVVKCVN